MDCNPDGIFYFMSIEVWKFIPYSKKRYMVSNLGNIKSLCNNKEKPLKFGTDGRGYYNVGIYYEKYQNKTERVHVLVAESFLNYKRNGKLDYVIDHIDGNKKNNRLDNLQIITNRQNIIKSKKNSQLVGTYFYKKNGTWKAHIRINSKLIHLGCFKTQEEAKIAYENKKVETTL